MYLSNKIESLKKVNPKLKFTSVDSYKIGMNQIAGLEHTIAESFKPIREALRSKVYWDSQLNFEIAEYESRDGFIPHSHNCGGLILSVHVPECERYDWGFLEFGELTEEYLCDENPRENEGELDAYLRIWFKFEGINEDGELEFYINASGGNNDAPYFRINSLPTLFEASFKCKSVADLKRVAAPHVRKLLKLLK